MRCLADIASPLGITLVLENHFNTMTTGPRITHEIVEGIGRQNVKILYDQANICFLSGEDYTDCIDIQKGLIGYVHVKDLVFKNNNAGFKAGSVTHVTEEERAVSSRIPGEGILPWDKIIRLLNDTGYDGYLSLEYERRWHPKDLPLAEIGMKQGAHYLHDILRNL
jgi:L-ribulose-5-phosphate 3-epimerase